MSLDENIKNELAKTYDEVKEDIFLRKDVFKDEPWYGDIELYTRIGVCQPSQKDIFTVRKALKMLGYKTTFAEINGRPLVVSANARTKKSRSKEQER